MSTHPYSINSPDPASLEVPLSREVLTALFGTMLRVRLLAKRFRSSVHNSESIIAGTLQNVSDRDLVVSATPNPILESLCGSTLPMLIGDKKNHESPTLSQLLVPPTDAVASFAAGLALASRRAQSDAAVIVFTPGQKTRGTVFEQATQYAAEHRVPMVIVADWTASRSSSRNHDGTTLSRWPFPTIAVDGRDVIAVYRVTKEAISAARRGHGPTLVDCINFLAPGSRGRDERDPLLSFRGYLQRHNAWSDEWYSELEANLKREIAVPKHSKN